jgi:hypothetical protein
MPKEKQLRKLIPKIYKWNAENLGLFFFIKGQQSIVPTITIDQAIHNYFRFIGDDWDIETARAIYSRLQKEFYEDSKQDSGCH